MGSSQGLGLGTTCSRLALLFCALVTASAIADEKQAAGTSTEVAETGETRDSSTTSKGQNQRRVEEVPPIDQVPTRKTRELTALERSRLLQAIEHGVGRRYGEKSKSRLRDEVVAPGWAVYDFDGAEGPVSLAVFIAGSSKEAAQHLRTMDLLISIRSGFESVPDMGDEAYLYGRDGMILVRHSNMLFTISSETSPNKRKDIAKHMLQAVDPILEEFKE